jgi:guanine deaminase
MPNKQLPLIVRGTLIHTPVFGEVEVVADALVRVDSNGQILSVQNPASDSYDENLRTARASNALIELSNKQYLLPGLVDLHVHAPQWPQLGKALQLPLYDWLQKCTFPLEAKYADLEFARRNYESLVENLLANGTTTATYFGTIHLEATSLLADICLHKGQRALIGKVAMDNPDECPDFYRDQSTASALDETRALIEYIRNLEDNESGRVLPAVTPRFIPGCTDEMLEGLGGIANEYDCHVQTHCSESDWEHNYVIARHGVNDTQSLDGFRLLTDKTVLAHSNLINDEDMATIKMRNSGIAHCPLSNVYFSNAVFPARKALDAGLNIGLGTDIAGGPSPGILHNCRAAVNSSRFLEEGVNPTVPAIGRGTPNSRINYLEAFWMATIGGAKTLGLNVGQFAEGYQFDAIVIDANVADSNLHLWEDTDSSQDLLQKIVYGAERCNITKVWVEGKLLKGELTRSGL